MFFFFYILRVKREFQKKFFDQPDISLSFTEEEEIFFFFYIFRVKGEFHYAKQTRSTSWITTYNSLRDVEEELFFFFCML